MAIINQNKSLATKDSNSHELYENRKVYKEKSLMSESHRDEEPQYIIPGVAEFWYDRQLYGKINQQGDIIIMKEDFLKTLGTSSDNTYYALNFVALAFNEMKRFMEKETISNKFPNQNTLFATLEPAVAWEGVYNNYHDYYKGTYEVFFNYLDTHQRAKNINNFDDFMEEFYFFARNVVVKANNPVTLSGFITHHKTDPRCGGLTIDLFRARASNDPIKDDLFLKDINFNFFKHAANSHGFVINKNVPWRLTANLKSQYMKLLMESPAFEVTYTLGPRNIFDTYYLKSYVLDLIFLRKYMYDFYNSLTAGRPIYSLYDYCKKTQKIKKIIFPRKRLTAHQIEKKYTVKDYWMEQAYRYRLLELNHNLKEENIRLDVKKAKSIYDIRGENAALRFLHNQAKRFFLNEYNLSTEDIRRRAPMHEPAV